MTVSDVPRHEDFLNIGSDHLQLAWDQVADLLTDLADGFDDYDQDTKDEYWNASRRILLTALTIAQQGVELTLKGYIAKVSPYLLIQNPAGKLPGPSAESDLSFAEFKTIDAQDLVKMVTAFTGTSLSEPFQRRFEELRRWRNQIMHTIGEKISIEPAQLVEIILEVHGELFPNNHWPTDRIRFLERSPVAHLGADDFTRNRVCWELELVLDLLKPSKVKKLLGIDKKQRRYSCPKCLSEANRDGGFEHRLAVLTPKSPKATSLFCFVCNETFPVKRESCENSECEGNVFHDEWGCLSCAF